MSHLSLSESASLCSFRFGRSNEVEVRGYHQALRALQQIAGDAGGDPKQVGLDSLRIGGGTTLAAGGEISDRIMQTEGRWKECSGSFKLCTSNNLKDTIGIPQVAG